MMKIIMVIKGLHQAPGGAERVFCQIADYLTKKHAVTCITFDSPGQKPFYELPEYINHIYLGVGNTRTPSSFLNILKKITTLRKKINRSNCDVIISFMHSSFIPVSFSIIGRSIPVIACEHTSIAHYKNHPIQFILYLISIPFIKRITIPMDSVREKYPHFIKKKMVTVSNPIMKITSDCPPILQRNKKILSIGRFDDAKGHHILLDAFSDIAEQFPEWDLIIIGDGPTRENLLKKVRLLKLENRVLMPGIIHKIEPFFLDAQIFALASRYESFGLVVAEAMSAGLACITFANCPGASDLIEHNKSGLLCYGDMCSSSLAESLKQLIKDDETRRRLGETSKKIMLKKFSIDMTGSSLEKILEEIKDH